MSAVPMVFGLPLTLAAYVYIVMTAYTFQFVEPMFLYFFRNFPYFALRVRLRVRVRL